MWLFCFVYGEAVLRAFGVNSLSCLSHFLIDHCLSMGMVLWPVLSGDDSSGRESPLSPPERLPIRRSSTRDKNRRGETCFLLTTGDYTCTADGGIRKGRRAFNQILTGDWGMKRCKVSRARDSLPAFSRGTAYSALSHSSSPLLSWQTFKHIYHSSPHGCHIWKECLLSFSLSFFLFLTSFFFFFLFWFSMYLWEEL